MLTKKNILELETRKKIYSYISTHPGLHKRELSRILGIPKTTLSYHLNYFIKKEILSERKDNGYKRYFISTTNGSVDKKLFSLLREPIPRDIILLTCLYSYLTKKQIIKLLTKDLKVNKHPTTIDFHLQKLLKMNILGCTIINNKKKYELNNPEIFYEFLLLNEKSFNQKERVTFFLFYLNDVPRYMINNIINVTYDILPHPYHL